MHNKFSYCLILTLNVSYLDCVNQDEITFIFCNGLQLYLYVKTIDVHSRLRMNG